MSSRFRDGIRENRSHVTEFGPFRFRARTVSIVMAAAFLMSIVTGCSSAAEKIPGGGMFMTL